MCDNRRITAYLKDQLDLDAKLEVLDHLEACPNCWYQLYLLKKLPSSFYKFVKQAPEAA